MTCTDPAGGKVGAIPKDQLRASEPDGAIVLCTFAVAIFGRPTVGARSRALSGRFHVSVSL